MSHQKFPRLAAGAILRNSLGGVEVMVHQHRSPQTTVQLGSLYFEPGDKVARPTADIIEEAQKAKSGTSLYVNTTACDDQLAPEKQPAPPLPTAHDIVTAAAGHMQDRAATYDKPQGERSMAATVQAFRAVTGIELSEEQGWLFMILLKAVRSQQGQFKLDNYEDGAAYFALAGEAAANGERNV